ncbi:hypothetical protein DRO69_05335 [Candidatus Bathyarchaeota archaeon]|nr:MAG: hypothetical protein DRO69_05335 [Candidatus Bathyarchaeota archaeon]
MFLIFTINTIINVLYLMFFNDFNLVILVTIFAMQFILILLLRKIHKFKSSFLILISLLILSVPTSFRNVFGGDYGDVPVSWYNVYFVLSLLTFLLSSRKFEKLPIKVSFLFFIWLIIEVLHSYDFYNALKDAINFFPLLFCYFISIKNIVRSFTSTLLILMDLYVVSALSLLLPLLIQIFLFLMQGVALGKLDIMAGRIGFGVIFSDYSFLSLFFSTASMIAFFMKKRRIIACILLLASILTTARTGMFSFVLSIMFLGILDSAKRAKGLKLIKTLGVVVLTGGIGLLILTNLRSGDILDPAGRLSSMEKAFSIILKNPLFGVGLGTEAFKEAFGFAIPHNIIVQSLLQIGIPGTVFLIIIFANLWFSLWKGRPQLNAILYSFTTLLVGSMFIPDIISSRFLMAMILLLKIAREERRVCYT